MKYTFLELQQETGKFVYRERPDPQDRQKEPITILGLPGSAFVFAPKGKEKIWKKKLFEYVEERLEKQQRSIQDAMQALQQARSQT